MKTSFSDKEVSRPLSGFGHGNPGDPPFSCRRRAPPVRHSFLRGSNSAVPRFVSRAEDASVLARPPLACRPPRAARWAARRPQSGPRVCHLTFFPRPSAVPSSSPFSSEFHTRSLLDHQCATQALASASRRCAPRYIAGGAVRWHLHKAATVLQQLHRHLGRPASCRPHPLPLHGPVGLDRSGTPPVVRGARIEGGGASVGIGPDGGGAGLHLGAGASAWGGGAGAFAALGVGSSPPFVSPLRGRWLAFE